MLLEKISLKREAPYVKRIIRELAEEIDYENFGSKVTFLLWDENLINFNLLYF